ncbi:MAG: CocE/NonD family hydrolase [Promethearchaeota archaeon]
MNQDDVFMEKSSEKVNSGPFNLEEISQREYIYRDYVSSSYHLVSSDGVPIAMDVLLPRNLPEDEKVPAILHQTRYWRAFNFRAPFKWFVPDPYDPKIAKVFTRLGYSFVIVDVRGTGASGGTRQFPFSPEEISDGKLVIDWIIKQPWSNGLVFSYGNSYSGTTAELSASLQHPALRGVICKHDPWDFYNMIFPGGCLSEKFTYYWSTLGKGLDQTKGSALKAFKPINPLLGNLGPLLVKGVKPVSLENREIPLREAAQIHRDNHYPIDYKERVTFRDDPIDDKGTLLDEISIFNYKNEIEKLNIPLYTFGSWQDSIMAEVVINRFLNFSNPQIALIGDWDHKALHKANPYFPKGGPADINREAQIKDWVMFFDKCIENKVKNEKVLYYFTMGEEKWKQTKVWPPDGQAEKVFYLNDEHALSINEPTSETGFDEYKVDFSATTGMRNRYYTLLSLPVHYHGREKEDKKLLVHDSKPLEKDIEITGHPIVHLYLSTTHDDGMIIAYLEFIDDKGHVHMITEGMLRLIHRKISKSKPPYKITTPYHSFKREDAMAVVPGEIMEVTFALLPTSILIKKGYRIRLAIAGADKDSFPRYPSEGEPILKVERNKNHASNVVLPIMER